MSISDRLHELALSQRGVVVRRQLIEIGVTDYQLATFIRSRNWYSPYRGVYVLPGAPFDERAKALAAVLSSPALAAIAYRTAAAIWGAPVPFPVKPDIVTKYGRPQRDGWFDAHRTRIWRPIDFVENDGLLVTSPVRTLIDVSGELTVDELGRCVDAMLMSNVLDLHLLASSVERFHSSPGRSMYRLGLALEQRLSDAPRGESPLETKVGRVLYEAELGELVEQFEVDVFGKRYRLDFFYPQEMVAIEVDGYAVHGNRTAFDRDRERQNALAAADILVLRFTSTSSPERIISATRRALDLRRDRHS
jgi:very-short-patch-repair endonuclease